jgi:RNA polymerase sigma-70 factor (ECF subfamily)
MRLALDSLAGLFEGQRPRLVALGYRLLGSRAEADDIVQDAWVRLQRSVERGEEIESLPAWLTRVTTRLALDLQRSAPRRRETYVGPWLPEPIASESWQASSPEAERLRIESLSLSCLTLLETLSPLERAAWVLVTVFDEEPSAVADVLGREPAAVRQLCHRARAHLEAGRGRFTATREAHERLLMAMANATATGDLAGLAALLTADVVVLSDSGGRRRAATRPLRGVDHASRFLMGVARKSPFESVRVVVVNGAPAFLWRRGEDRGLVALACDGDRIAAVYLLGNPDKLKDFS